MSSVSLFLDTGDIRTGAALRVNQTKQKTLIYSVVYAEWLRPELAFFWNT
jgi:hypothetical protein